MCKCWSTHRMQMHLRMFQRIRIHQNKLKKPTKKSQIKCRRIYNPFGSIISRIHKTFHQRSETINCKPWCIFTRFQCHVKIDRNHFKRTAILPKWLNDQNRLRLVPHQKLIYPTRTGDLRDIRPASASASRAVAENFFHFFSFFSLFSFKIWQKFWKIDFFQIWRKLLRRLSDACPTPNARLSDAGPTKKTQFRA